MEIYVHEELSDGQRARLGEIAANDGIHLRVDGAGQAELGRCEVAFGNPPPDWLPEAEALRWLQLGSVGFGEYTRLDWPSLGRRLTLTNLAGFFNDPVAESALAGIMALYRGIDRLLALQQTREWVGDAMRPSLRSLRGATVVLFGYGGINRRLAEMLAPFECTIVPFASDWTPEALDAALARAAIVVSTVPDTPATRGVFGRERLALLPKDAIFANSGRGSVVDEAALADALETGALGGAVIDVTIDEPLPPDSRLWSCPNTILTQHTGGGTTGETDGKIEVFAANLERYRRGAPLDSMVDFSRGY